MKEIIQILIFLISALYLIFVFIIIYHLIRFGIGTKPKSLALFFFWGSIFLLFLFLLAFLRIDWEKIFEILGKIFSFK